MRRIASEFNFSFVSKRIGCFFFQMSCGPTVTQMVGEDFREDLHQLFDRPLHG